MKLLLAIVPLLILGTALADVHCARLEAMSSSNIPTEYKINELTGSMTVKMDKKKIKVDFNAEGRFRLTTANTPVTPVFTESYPFNIYSMKGENDNFESLSESSNCGDAFPGKLCAMRDRVYKYSLKQVTISGGNVQFKEFRLALEGKKITSGEAKEQLLSQTPNLQLKYAECY